MHALECSWIHGTNGAVPAAGRVGRVALQRRFLADEMEADVIAGAFQKTGRHKTVAAVVAGTTKDRHARPRLDHGHRLFGDGATGIFHERLRSHACGDCRAVGARHLIVGQHIQLRHAVPVGRGNAPIEQCRPRFSSLSLRSCARGEGKAWTALAVQREAPGSDHLTGGTPNFWSIDRAGGSQKTGEFHLVG